MLNNRASLVALILILLSVEPLMAQPRSSSPAQHCAELVKDATGVDPVLAEHVREFKSGEELIAIKPSQDRQQVLVSDGVARWWLPRTAVKLSKKDDCRVPRSEIAQAGRGWWWLIEAGVGGQESTSPYSQFVTEVPNPNQVEGLQDPIILEVEPGSSSRVGVGALIPWREQYRWRGLLAWEQRSFQLPAKVNPADSSPIRLDERVGTEVKFTHQMWILEGGVEYDLPLQLPGKTKSFVGVAAELQYSPDPATLTVRTGTIFKATETELKAGPEGLELGLSISAGVILIDHVRLQLDLSQDAAWGLKAGYQWQF
ncbi:MAG: hypothetical protein IT288_00280 [Bdellovibrionales bacterium]|nr:hypothetical protein [Bdellovibrionales bacterium]